MKILLLSAYNTQSHNYWCNLLMNKLPEYRWTFLELPPRKFSWRIRGNALSWFAEQSEILNRDYDTVLATSMVDLSTLIGLFPHLGRSKKVFYFHENQFEYPLSESKNVSNVESMMVNLYGALCADKVIFNSKYNKESFFLGAEKLLKKINDHSPITVLNSVKDKTSILPVPICNKSPHKTDKIKNSIIWNHRWEYDKNPEDFYKTLLILKKKNIDFKLIMMGIQFKNSPPIFNKIREDFNNNILCWGQQTKEEYLAWLNKGEIIVSTAIHEFQGLAVMEGVQYGAEPVVPDRLSYPEWFDKDYLFGNTPSEMSEHIIFSFKNTRGKPNLHSLTWDSLKKRYIEVLT